MWWAFDQRGLIRLKPRFVHVNKVKVSPLGTFPQNLVSGAQWVDLCVAPSLQDSELSVVVLGTSPSYVALPGAAEGCLVRVT